MGIADECLNEQKINEKNVFERVTERLKAFDVDHFISDIDDQIGELKDMGAEGRAEIKMWKDLQDALKKAQSAADKLTDHLKDWM